MLPYRREARSREARSPETPSVQELRDIAFHLHKYARRWAVGQSLHVEDAIVYDAAMSTLRNFVAPQTIGSTSMTATTDRYQRYGPEPQALTYAIPVDPVDALVVLHRFARRYTNGRGTYTAALVNDAARQIAALGGDLSETAKLDGSIWAADGVEGLYDGLSPEQRQEAMDAAHMPH